MKDANNTAVLEPSTEAQPLTAAQAAQAAQRAHANAVEKHAALKQRLRGLESELAAIVSERRALTLKLANGDDGCISSIDALDRRWQDVGRQIEGVSTLLSDAEQEVAQTNKLREESVEKWQRSELVAAFDAAKAAAHKAFEELRSHYSQACTSLAAYASAIDNADFIASQLGSPFPAMREALITQLLDPPNPTLMFFLKARGYSEKFGGWGPGRNWSLEVIPLFAPSQNRQRG